MESFKFADLSCGIGGIRIPFEELGGECVFSCDNDRWARITYRANFGEVPVGDIREVDAADIPDFDVLLAGFPCQAFSTAPNFTRANFGCDAGFDNEEKGTLFFEVARILAEKKPRAFLLENVKNLVHINDGREFGIIMETLQSLGYFLQWRVLDSADWGVQHRERVYIAGFRDTLGFDFDGIVPERERFATCVADILETDVDNTAYTITDGLWKMMQGRGDRKTDKTRRFGYYPLDPSDTWVPTLTANYCRDGRTAYILQEGMNPRRLSPRECANLQGFPQSFVIPDDVSRTQLWKQFGNSVTVPVIRSIAELLVESM